MNKLFIPAVGDRIALTAPWEFSLYLERRNFKFAVTQGLLTQEEFNHAEARYQNIFAFLARTLMKPGSPYLLKQL